MPNSSSDTNHKWVDGMINVMVPIIVAAMSGLGIWLSKLDDRQYQMGQDYVSKQDLKDSMTGLEQSFDRKFSALQMALEAQQQADLESRREMLQEIRNTNNNVQQLAIKLESRTK